MKKSLLFAVLSKILNRNSRLQYIEMTALKKNLLNSVKNENCEQKGLSENY